MLASGAEPEQQSVMPANPPAEDAPRPSEAHVLAVAATPKPMNEHVPALEKAIQEPPAQHDEILERCGSSDAAADAAPEPAVICERTAGRDSEAQPQMQFQLTSVDLGRRSTGVRWATIVIAVAVALFGIAYLLQANPASTLTGTMEWPLRGADPISYQLGRKPRGGAQDPHGGYRKLAEAGLHTRAAATGCGRSA
jgi:hypothetical protein